MRRTARRAGIDWLRRNTYVPLGRQEAKVRFLAAVIISRCINVTADILQFHPPLLAGILFTIAQCGLNPIPFS